MTFNYQGERYDGIENVNLEIAPEECVLLCGRSGCGKTTVTRLINGLIPHFYPGDLNGGVAVNGMDVTKTPMYEIAEKAGSVFQNPRTQFFNVDTDSEIAFGVENFALPIDQLRERVAKATGDLHVENLMGRSIFELSGGEKQKLAFASIYAMSPDIYILDEPSSNLDVYAIDDLRKTICLLKQQGKTIIVAEHRLYYLKDLVDRIVYVEQGRITGTYTSGEFLSIPVSERESMGLRTMDQKSIAIAGKKPLQTSHVLEIRDVNLRYKKQPVMRNINLCAAKSDIIGIIGKNGAGKSTFARTLCGLHKEYDGVFLWNGKEMDAKQRLRICYMVMQDVNYQLFSESVEKECCFGIKNPDMELAARTMKELNLYEYRNRHPNTLSGGQKQRTAVAVSMICGKEILIFDEPTSGLDFDSMLQVSRLILKLSDLGKIIFVATHDFEFLSLVCNRVVHFDSSAVKDDFTMSQENIKRLQDFFIVS